MRMPPDSAAANGRLAEAAALPDLPLCTAKYPSAGREPALEGEPSPLGSLLGLIRSQSQPPSLIRMRGSGGLVLPSYRFQALEAAGTSADLPKGWRTTLAVVQRCARRGQAARRETCLRKAARETEGNGLRPQACGRGPLLRMPMLWIRKAWGQIRRRVWAQMPRSRVGQLPELRPTVQNRRRPPVACELTTSLGHQRGRPREGQAPGRKTGLHPPIRTTRSGCISGRSVASLS